MKKTKANAAWTIYHNPRCSKSRATLALLKQHNIDPVVIDYIKSPPTATELKSVLQKLGMRPDQLIRTGEEEYESKIAGKKLSDTQLIATLITHPVLIERPIVVVDERAAIGRPPENILQLLQ
jgi:arsenate reductase (glutaredoxin)